LFDGLPLADAALAGGAVATLYASLCAPMPSLHSGADMSQSRVRLQSTRIAFVQACWHRDIVDRSRVAFLKGLEQHGLAARQVDCFEVPGAFEIPLHAKLLAKTGRYAAVVAAGFVVDGGIYRHEFVASSVIDALMRVQLDTEVPVISVVLTPQRFHEHEEHRKFFSEHFVIKGEEAAHACIGAISGIQKLRSLHTQTQGVEA
jgi:6,7-dimethyl-8-ribityllumazine synthase